MRASTRIAVTTSVVASALAAFALAACGVFSGSGLSATNQPEDGTAGGVCYGNGTCNAGLACVSNVCVDLDGGSVGEGGKIDAQSAGDASGADDDATADASDGASSSRTDSGCPVIQNAQPFPAGDCTIDSNGSASVYQGDCYAGSSTPICDTEDDCADAGGYFVGCKTAQDCGETPCDVCTGLLVSTSCPFTIGTPSKGGTVAVCNGRAQEVCDPSFALAPVCQTDDDCAFPAACNAALYQNTPIGICL